MDPTEHTDWKTSNLWYQPELLTTNHSSPENIPVVTHVTVSNLVTQLPTNYQPPLQSSPVPAILEQTVETTVTAAQALFPPEPAYDDFIPTSTHDKKPLELELLPTSLADTTAAVCTKDTIIKTERLKKRRTERDPNIPSKAYRKQLREEGKEYVTAKGKLRPARFLKEPCPITCQYQCASRFTQQQRQQLLNEFWKLTEKEKFAYIVRTTWNQGVKKKRRKHRSERRYTFFRYFLNLDDQDIVVCKRFYTSTLDIALERVYYVHKKVDMKTKIKKKKPKKPRSKTKKTKRARPFKRKPLQIATKTYPEETRLFAKVHIESFPKIAPDVKITTKNKAYYENIGVYSVAKMYNFYHMRCGAIGMKPVNEAIYRHMHKQILRDEDPMDPAKKLIEPITKPIQGLEERLEKAFREHYPSLPDEYFKSYKYYRPRKDRVSDRGIITQLFQSGKEHYNRQGKLVPARQMKEPCKAPCKFRCTEQVTEEERHAIFNSFWMLSKAEKAHFIACTSTAEDKVKDAKDKNGEIMQIAYKAYSHYFTVNNITVMVCQKFYLSTLDISAERVYNMHKFNREMIVKKLNDDVNLTQTSDVAKEYAIKHIESFPPAPTQCINFNPKTQSDLEGLGICSVTKMYHMYREKCLQEERVPVTDMLYRSLRNTSLVNRLLGNIASGKYMPAPCQPLAPIVKYEIHQMQVDSITGKPLHGLEERLEQACKANFPTIPEEYFKSHKYGKRSRKDGISERGVITQMFQSGKGHYNRLGKYVQPRQLKKPCIAPCKFRCTEQISEFERHAVFDHFWGLTKAEKTHFIACTSTAEDKVKEIRKKSGECKQIEFKAYAHYFTVNDQTIMVCQKFYLSTLDISAERVYNVHKMKKRAGDPSSGMCEGKMGLSRASDVDKQFALVHIDSFPPIPTQCINITSKNQAELEMMGIMSVTKMYKMYKDKCLGSGKTPVKEALYRTIRNTSLINRLLPEVAVETLANTQPVPLK